MLFHHDWIFFAIFFPFSQHLSFISSVPSSSICSANQLILYILLYTCPLWFVSFPLKMVLLGWKACLMLSLSVCSTVYLFVCLYILLSFLFMSSCFIWASYICLSLGCFVCLSVIFWLRLLSSTGVVLLGYNLHASSNDISIKMKYCDINLAHMWHMDYQFIHVIFSHKQGCTCKIWWHCMAGRTYIQALDFILKFMWKSWWQPVM